MRRGRAGGVWRGADIITDDDELRVAGAQGRQGRLVAKGVLA